MFDVKIHLADATFDGAVTMSSATSKFSAIRIDKSLVSMYANDLNNPGIYFLLIGTDTVYVGQSGLDVIGKRIMNTHSGSIDKDWHTVLAFPCSGINMSANEFLFLENAMCEYVHKHFAHCATSTPSQKNCNADYRSIHYNLNVGSIRACNQYVEDIIHFISLFPSIFPKQPEITAISQDAPVSSVTPDSQLYYYRSRKGDIDGTAEIRDDAKRITILKAGSKISPKVSENFKNSEALQKKRELLTDAGKIADNVLLSDIEFTSPSTAATFLCGRSVNGYEVWKSIDNDELLKKLT